MDYSALATSQTPALLIYLLDISASMDKHLGNKSRFAAAWDALAGALQTMVYRSTKGRSIQPRYRIAIYLYSDEVYDFLGGIKTVDEVVQYKFPQLETGRGTDSAKAFAAAAELLATELPRIQDHPAPLICHLTDDKFTGKDPEPIVRSIMQMRNRDGRVLVENIFISNKLGRRKGETVNSWAGIQPGSPLKDHYADKLRAMSSPVPPSYHLMLTEMGSTIAPGSVLLFPGNTPDFISLGFQMSGATPTRSVNTG